MASKLLAVLQPDFELYPEGQRVGSKRLIGECGGRVGVDGICERAPKRLRLQRRIGRALQRLVDDRMGRNIGSE